MIDGGAVDLGDAIEIRLAKIEPYDFHSPCNTALDVVANPKGVLRSERRYSLRN
jgi:hypothetical protein